MATFTENAVALWTWPLQAARLGTEILETSVGAQSVIAARMPTIASAMKDPLNADNAELSRMVTEKVSAFGASRRSIDAAGEAVRRVSAANASAMRRVATGGVLWPADWMRLAESNMAAAATLAALPSAALAPLHSGVTRNRKRLGR